MTTAPTALRGYRHAAGLTLRQLAERLGFSHVFMGEIERAIRPLPLSHVSALAAALGRTEEEVLLAAPPSRIDLEGFTVEERVKLVMLAELVRASRAA